MHYSDGGCWAARGRAAKRAAGRTSMGSVDSGARAEQQTEHGVGAVRMGGGGAGGGGAGVRLQRLGRAG
jgi:hypothetical protein